MQVNCTKVLILAIIGEICRKHIGRNNYLHQKFETLELYNMIKGSKGIIDACLHAIRCIP